MKVTSERTTTNTKRWFTITEDNPVHPFAYSRTGKKVRVDSGVIEYQWSPEGWTVRGEYDVYLYCTVLKKDGSDSLNTHTRHPEPLRLRTRSLELTDEFAWLQTIIDLLRPAGDLFMVKLADQEV